MYLTAKFNSTFQRIAAAACVLFAVMILIKPAYAAQGILQGLQLCYRSLIPSLFPFLFIVDYLFAFLCSRENIKPGAGVAAAVVFGLCGGFPMGAKALSDLVTRGQLSAKKASFLLSGCANAGPAYLISAVGLGLFHNALAGILLFISLSAASLVCAGIALLVCRGSRGGTPVAPPPAAIAAPAFATSLAYALNATLSFCAYVVFFSCLGSYFSAFSDWISGGALLRWTLNAMLEVVTGCAAAAHIGSVTGLLLAAASVSLCGISVILQLRALTQKSGMTLHYLIASRPLHVALTLLFLRILIPLFPSVSDVYANTLAYSLFSLSPIFSFFFILVVVIFMVSDKRSLLFAKR